MIGMWVTATADCATRNALSSSAASQSRQKKVVIVIFLMSARNPALAWQKIAPVWLSASATKIFNRDC